MNFRRIKNAPSAKAANALAPIPPYRATYDFTTPPVTRYPIESRIHAREDAYLAKLAELEARS
jgi:hypothetical protein